MRHTPTSGQVLAQHHLPTVSLLLCTVEMVPTPSACFSFAFVAVCHADCSVSSLPCTGEELEETLFAHSLLHFRCLPQSGSASIWMSDVSVFLEVGYLGARPCLRAEHTHRRQIPCFYHWYWPRSRFSLSCPFNKGLCYHHIGPDTYIGSRS